ncbi:hypothetical protein GJ496_007974 [Pomphorhynchus laevis]|nr:hypothetical protein GJ496_007974 [Pomphorhynchus laevis]
MSLRPLLQVKKLSSSFKSLPSSATTVFFERHKSQMQTTLVEFSRDSLDSKISDFDRSINDAYKVFNTIDDNSPFVNLFEDIKYIIDEATPHLYRLSDYYLKFRFSQDVPFNGYFSFLEAYFTAIDRLQSEINEIKEKRRSSYTFLWNSTTYFKTIQAWINLFRILNELTKVCTNIILENQTGNLFLDCNLLTKEECNLLISQFKSRNIYGRTLAFQFDDSLNSLATAIVIAFVCYADSLSGSIMGVTQTAASIFQSPKYKMNPELRSDRMIEVMNRASLSLTKSFYGFSDLNILRVGSSLKYGSVDINEAFVITGSVKSDEPSYKVNVRLISNKYLPDMNELPCKVSIGKVVNNPQSDVLLFHVHGGGFISMSSQSHEVYLRPWTRELNVPILSVDYTLVPNGSFPTQLNECFIAYKWALENPSKLGWTGKKIVVVGDSAGGNLACSLSLFTKHNGVRVPDAMCLFYPVLTMGFNISPSRLLSSIDILLNGETMVKTAAAYCGLYTEENKQINGHCEEEKLLAEKMLPNINMIMEQVQQNKNLLENPFISPLSADENLLKDLPSNIYIWACGSDPLLDDSVQMAINIRNSGGTPKLRVFPRIMHGFLNFYSVAKICYSAFQSSLKDLQELITSLKS